MGISIKICCQVKLLAGHCGILSVCFFPVKLINGWIVSIVFSRAGRESKKLESTRVSLSSSRVES